LYCGEGWQNYAKASFCKIRFFNIALPEPVFKYFSRLLACISIGTAIYDNKINGIYDFVD